MRTIKAILDCASSALCTVESSERVCDAVARMSDLDISTLLVLDHDDKIIGLFTEHDVLLRVVAKQRDPRSITVVEVMTEGLLTVSLDASLEEAMAILNECKRDRLVVTDCGEICGLVTKAEISRYMVSDRDALINDLTYYITH